MTTINNLTALLIVKPVGFSHWHASATRNPSEVLPRRSATQTALRAAVPRWLPRTSAPSSGAGCCGGRWRGRARSTSGTAGSCGTAGSGTGTPSCSRSGSTNTPPGGRLEREGKKKRSNKWTLRKPRPSHFIGASNPPGSKAPNQLVILAGHGFGAQNW